jgi:hypothetical protein
MSKKYIIRSYHSEKTQDTSLWIMTEDDEQKWCDMAQEEEAFDKKLMSLEKAGKINEADLLCEKREDEEGYFKGFLNLGSNEEIRFEVNLTDDEFKDLKEKEEAWMYEMI